jgi:hypothetical protein
LFKIDSTELKAKLEPCPAELLKNFEVLMQPFLKAKNKELKEWLQSSTS